MFLAFLPISIAACQIGQTILALGIFAEAIVIKRLSFPALPINRALFAYLIATAIATAFAVNPSRSFKGTDSLFVITVIYLVFVNIQDRARLKKCLTVLIVSTTIAAVYGLLQHTLEMDIFRITRPIALLKHVNNDLNAPVRIGGFSSYMTLGGQLAMMIPIVWVSLLAAKRLLHRLLLLGALSAMCLALLWTYTRSAWVGVACAMLVVGFLGRKSVALLLALLLIPITALIAQPSLVSRSLSVVNTKENKERLYTWESTLYMFEDHPLTGIGKGNYARLTPKYRERYKNFAFTSRAHAHNNILQILVEGGVISIICFLWMWERMFRGIYRGYARLPEHQTAARLYTLGCLGGLIAFFAQGFFEFNFGDSEAALMMWCIAAFAFKIPEILSDSESVSEEFIGNNIEMSELLLCSIGKNSSER